MNGTPDNEEERAKAASYQEMLGSVARAEAPEKEDGLIFEEGEFEKALKSVADDVVMHNVRCSVVSDIFKNIKL